MPGCGGVKEKPELHFGKDAKETNACAIIQLFDGATWHLRTDTPEAMQVFFFGINSELQRVRAGSTLKGRRAHANTGTLTLAHTLRHERHNTGTLEATLAAIKKAGNELTGIQTSIDQLKKDVRLLVVRSR
jgi:hypothetical protein